MADDTRKSDDSKEAQTEAPDADIEEAEVIEEPQENLGDAEPAESESAAETPVADTPDPVQPAKTGGGAGRLVLTTVIAAVLAAGGAFVATRYADSREADLRAALSSLSDVTEAQAARIAALEAAPSPAEDALAKIADNAAALTAATADIAEQRSAIEDLATRLADLDIRLQQLEKRPMTEALSPQALEAYEREVAELREIVAGQKAEAVRIEEAARETAQQTLERAAMTRLMGAVNSGGPFRAALDDWQAQFGTSAPGILLSQADGGVPTLSALRGSFPAAARAALAADRAENNGESGGNRFVGFLQEQLGARSVTPREGDDTDAILSRAEAALRDADLATCLAELGGLGSTPAAEMDAWMATARLRIDALSAVDELAAELGNN